jgi:hypothetical protein
MIIKGSRSGQRRSLGGQHDLGDLHEFSKAFGLRSVGSKTLRILRCGC